MADFRAIDLEILRRDWIVGVRGRRFRGMVERRLDQLQACSRSARARGALVTESDPVAFVAAFVACVSLRVPVVVGSPRWRATEWAQLSALVRPGVTFGTCTVDDRGAAPVILPPPGAVLIPTGGTSGGMRLAVHDWASLSAAASAAQTVLGPGPVHSGCVLPLFHVSGLMQVVRSLLSGGQIAFPAFAELQAGRFPHADAPPFCLSLVPTQLQRLLSRASAIEALRRYKTIILGGAAAPGPLLDEARRLRLPVMLSYGLTETAAMVSALPPEDFLAGETNAGAPLPHVELGVVDPAGVRCPAGTAGEIVVAGEPLFKGYFGASGEGAPRQHATGDEGFIDAAGRLHVLGRKDRIVTTRGEQVDPAEVEAVLREIGGLGQVMVLDVPHPEWGRQLVAFCEGATEPIDAEALDRELRVRLVHYKVPRQVIAVARLPLNAQGKIDRDAAKRLLARSGA